MLPGGFGGAFSRISVVNDHLKLAACGLGMVVLASAPARARAQATTATPAGSVAQALAFGDVAVMVVP